MYAVLRGVRYNVISKKLPADTGGHCTSPHEPNPEVCVCSTITNPSTFLENLIHEVTHACYWDLDEEAVDTFASCLTTLLLKLGVTLDLDKCKEMLISKKKRG